MYKRPSPILLSQMFYAGTCGFAAGMIFGKLIPETVYQAHSHDGGLTCLGAGCFFYSHVIQIVLNAVALVLVLVVVKRTADLYRESKMGH